MILFCEYVIPETHRDEFDKWFRTDAIRWNGVEILENTGQPGVFVEIRRCGSAAEAAEKEKERREGRSWVEMEQWIKGGKDGLRIWTFRPLEISE
ncbi:hypothetical protein [Cohnella lupini]|uniref:NIPSNAP protein n=1 Tax=Cohnella lupini TaxID=1294267 RepID=A0A3D9I6R4_9BACL|nr:hypothetical protein [Cohnella lupini]RED57219.1 hypothetical protein DFP95_111133 [Cohnella lupini]